MKITSRSHYGVQVMTGLARSWGKGPLSLTKIAHREKLPYEYLEQIMISLRRGGLVKARRGAHGGYLLSRDPRKISFREIIQTLEGEMAPVICVSKEEVICPSERFCPSKKIWGKIQDHFLTALESVKLKEVLE